MVNIYWMHAKKSVEGTLGYRVKKWIQNLKVIDCWFHTRDQSRYAPSQWETSLQCNDVSHWLGAYLDWSLPHCQKFKIMAMSLIKLQDFSMAAFCLMLEANLACCHIIIKPLPELMLTDCLRQQWLTNCSLVMPYGDIDLGHHWLR